jgi:DNA modification methylase
MKITMVPIDQIKPYKGNPRINAHAVEAVARSLKQFGWRQPLVTDKAGVLIVGDTRLKAAQSLGMTEAPVHVADMTKEQAKAYRLADNRLGELATWDDEALRKEIEGLKAFPDLTSILGWTPEELGILTAPQPNPGLTAADEVPEPRKRPRTKKGDLWILGEHRLLCGSSTKDEDVDKLMDGKQAAICATDPPYCIDYTGDRPEQAGKDWSDVYKEVEIKDPKAFFSEMLVLIKSILAPKAAIYIWHAHKRQAMLSELLEALGFLSHQQIIWVKPTPVFGRSTWHFQHEPCLMGWIQGSQPKADGNHDISSVWKVDFQLPEKGKTVKVTAAETDVWEVDWEGKARIIGNKHPTQKPVELFARPIRRHTKPGAVCFEPFSGSGSQIIACEQTGRRCYAMELEPTFVDVAVDRWEAFTGKKATLFPAKLKKQATFKPSTAARPKARKPTKAA